MSRSFLQRQMLPDCRCHLTPFVSTPAPTPRRSTASVGVSARALASCSFLRLKDFGPPPLATTVRRAAYLLVGGNCLSDRCKPNDHFRYRVIRSSGKAGAINEATSPPGRKESQEQIAAALVLCRHNAEVQLLFSIQNEAERGTFVSGNEPVTVKPRGDVTFSSVQWKRNPEKS